MNLEKINLTEELVLKASACKTQEELLALAHENGVTITKEQLPELMAEVAKKCSGEISDDALEAASAVGGKATYTNKYGKKYKVVTVGHYCSKFACKSCGAHGTPTDGEFHYGSCTIWGRSAFCNICKYMTFMDGLWLCDY